jgi:serine/threonine protein kinase
MTPERWQQIADVAEKALELDQGQRLVFLDQACSSDSDLRREVQALLDSGMNMPSDFLHSEPLSEKLIADLHGAVSVGALQTGQPFGENYRLVRKLGEGGMGQVWLAEQTAPVRRQVALKLIRAGMHDHLLVQRFQLEQQSLAIMDHSSIAKVFEAGTTSRGQPYFVMEYVPGQPITEYCDQKGLKIKDRLELFIQACEGVQHAHQKAIIHRDLKPANILVIEVEGKPVPRIIDFGLAKTTTPQPAGNSIFTQLGNFVGTPGYMSPEQADPDVRDIDTRTDVYSLGVVLYVLLVGTRPLDDKPGEKLPLDELLRRLREEEPLRPSARVSADRQTSSATAEARGCEPKQLMSQLRGDLDWITLKALERERARRYASASEFAADIKRYLNQEPVLAVPPSLAYQAHKFASRHRFGVAAVSAIVLLLFGFGALQTAEVRRITRERDRANQERDRADRERDRATRITGFMTNMFKVSDPSESRGTTITAREILDKASTDITTGLAKDPEAQSQMMQVMANTYLNLGLYPRAHELAKRALDLRMSLLGPGDPRTLESMALLGWIVDREGGHHDEAEALERRALTEERRVVGPGAPLTILDDGSSGQDIPG